jgi:hypothetical protein
MNFKDFHLLTESQDITNVTKSEMKPKHKGGDARKSYEFTYKGTKYSYTVAILGEASAKQLASITKTTKEDFIGKNKDDVFNDLTGVLYIYNGNVSWGKWVPTSTDDLPKDVIEDVKLMADLKQRLTKDTEETFGDLLDII